jgi:hypothetical protein
MIQGILSLYGLIVLVAGAWLYHQHLFVTPVLFFFGGVVFGFGLWLFCKQVVIFNSTRKTYGKLVGWGGEMPPNPNSPKMYYYAQVVFQSCDGSEHRITAATGDRIKPRTPIGSQIPMRYDPANPDDARVDTFFDFWGPSIIIMFFGAVTCVMSFAHGGYSPQ